MSHIIPHLQATSGGFAAFKGTSIRTGVQAATPPKPKPDRQVVVPNKDFLLFREVGLRPPDEGVFDIYELDKRLEGIDREKRMQVKTALINCGLLAGRRV